MWIGENSWNDNVRDSQAFVHEMILHLHSSIISEICVSLWSGLI